MGGKSSVESPEQLTAVVWWTRPFCGWLLVLASQSFMKETNCAIAKERLRLFEQRTIMQKFQVFSFVDGYGLTSHKVGARSLCIIRFSLLPFAWTAAWPP
ncbi:hypothetical protein CSUI_001715 [Cystoisospora suis]|uniref:Uncharacterized protein n=1 Tax=Cystoisospora suis TaxID=483139 RepID=A0A2C6L9F2_9APIC|nr:hypothetical protein CSUI_001715 [Cystoisospora suis]